MINRLLSIGTNAVIAKNYGYLIKTIFKAVLVKFALFLLLQIIDYFAELVYSDPKANEYIFYNIRFFFFAFSFIFHVVVIISFIAYLICLSSIEDDNDNVKETIAETYIKIVFAFYCLWTIVLIATFIPRIIIIIMNKDKFSYFIHILFSLKMFIMIIVYIEVLIMYILYNDIYDKKK